jgi:isopenicillin-N epimerase
LTQTTSRRFFVQAVSGLTAGSLSALEAAPAGSEDYWQAVKAQFPFRGGIIPMNAANLCPSPRAVSDRVAELTRDIDADCSHQNRAKFTKLASEARSKVAAHLGVDADEVALVRNTSEGNNLISAGLPLRSGDEILVWDQNHTTNSVAWDVRAARYGYVVRRVTTPPHPASPEQLHDVFVKAFTSRTRVLALTHVSGISGLRLPVNELCEEARRRGIYSHIDGAQSWGALHLKLKQMGCDSFAASAHK